MARVLNSVIVTTNDMGKALDYYAGALKLKAVGTYELPAEQSRRLWGLDRDYSIASVVLKRREADSFGYLRLVEMRGAKGSDIREGARAWDFGIFDVAFVVQDNEGKCAEIRDMGYDIPCMPVPYDVPFVAGKYRVTQAVVGGPNRAQVVFLERFNAPTKYGVLDLATGFSEIADSAQMVPNIDEALRFYHELLGLPLRGKFSGLKGPQYVDILNLQVDEPWEMCLLGSPDATGGCVEIISPQWSRGRQLPGQGSLLNYGLAALSFGTEDLDAVFGRMKSAGITIVCEPMDVELEAVGRTRAFSCRAPSDILCEVYQA